MTRINSGVDPSELSRQHLLAEHREIKRVPNIVKSGRYSMKGQPKQFKLGEGHVKFFYDKLQYLHRRYNKIYLECLHRGYNVTNFNSAFEGVPAALYNDWVATENASKLVRERIKERS